MPQSGTGGWVLGRQEEVVMFVEERSVEGDENLPLFIAEPC